LGVAALRVDFFWKTCSTNTTLSNRTVYTARYVLRSPILDNLQDTSGAEAFEGLSLLVLLARPGSECKSRFELPTQYNGFRDGWSISVHYTDIGITSAVNIIMIDTPHQAERRRVCHRAPPLSAGYSARRRHEKAPAGNRSPGKGALVRSSSIANL
jgi:hypothetical protein